MSMKFIYTTNITRIKGFHHTEESKYKISIAMRGKIRSDKYRKNISKSKIGNKNGMWKGDLVGYQSLHTWIRSHWGLAKKCSNINCEVKNPKVFDWANITGVYNRKKENWKELCRGCHIKLDRYKIHLKYV